MTLPLLGVVSIDDFLCYGNRVSFLYWDYPKLISCCCTPSVLVYKARANMTRSSKSYFDYSFLLYYISYDYEFIFIGKYI
jgi:hypothetical protein